MKTEFIYFFKRLENNSTAVALERKLKIIFWSSNWGWLSYLFAPILFFFFIHFFKQTNTCAHFFSNKNKWMKKTTFQ